MEQEILSQGELHTFVEKKHLRDRNSNILFTALVPIHTALNEIEDEEMDVRIRIADFDSAGRVELITSLDPHSYPISFDARWQRMEYLEDKYLYISGDHSKNKDIGRYEVKIRPIFP